MTYPVAENAILNIIRGLADWNKDNTSRGNHLVISSGASPHYAVLRQGEINSVPASIGQATSLTTTQTVIEIWQALNTPGTDLVTLEGLVDDMQREFEKYPYLNQGAGAGYWVNSIVAGEPIEASFGANGGRPFYMQEIRLDWTEERTVSAAE